MKKLLLLFLLLSLSLALSASHPRLCTGKVSPPHALEIQVLFSSSCFYLPSILASMGGDSRVLGSGRIASFHLLPVRSRQLWLQVEVSVIVRECFFLEAAAFENKEFQALPGGLQHRL
jgi:hypothetical protein